MKALLVCVILTVTIGATVAIVCTPETCSVVRCGLPGDAKDCSAGTVFVPKGGFCGCCNACLKELKEGELCGEQVRGSPPKTICKDNLVCKSFDSSEPTCIDPYASPPFVPPTHFPQNDCQANADAYAEN